MAMMIYKIVNSVNNKVYIGLTIRTLESRLRRHFDDATKHPHTLNKFHRAINKYGKDKFRIELIDEASTLKELNQKEKFWIRKCNSINNGMSNLIKAKNVKTSKEYFFDTLSACLKFLGIANKGIVMNRANGKCNTLWRDEWMFAYEDKEYADFHKFHYDPSCRSGIKVFLKKEDHVILFNSKAKACEFLHVKYIPLQTGMTINGYSVLLP